MEHKVIIASTAKHTEFLDITAEAESFVSKSKVREGVLHVHSRHTTAGIIINENEPGLLKDMENTFEKLIPRHADYQHDRTDGNAHSHLRALLCGSGKSVPIINGRLQLGTWQRIFLAEFDGPRRREVLLQITP